MNIHEYQAKQLLKKFGVPILAGGVAYTAEEAQKVAEGLKTPVFYSWMRVARCTLAARSKHWPRPRGGRAGWRWPAPISPLCRPSQG